jgi:putative sterol carrier protein
MALVYGSDEWEEAYQEILRKRKGIATQPYVIGTPEWVDAYEKAIQEDEIYKEFAADWEGTVVLHTMAEPDAGVERDIYILMDLWHGDCRSMRIVPPEVGEAADYVIAGSPTTWKRMGAGELDANKAVMQGKLRLKGDLGTMVRYSKASARLGKVSAKLRGCSPDKLDPEEASRLRVLEDEFIERLLSNGQVVEAPRELGYRATA